MNHTHQPPNSCQLLFTRSNSTTSHFLSRQSARLKSCKVWASVSNKFHSLEICINLHHSSKSKERSCSLPTVPKKITFDSFPCCCCCLQASIFKSCHRKLPMALISFASNLCINETREIPICSHLSDGRLKTRVKTESTKLQCSTYFPKHAN